MYADTLFLNNCIIACCIYIQTRSQCDWTKWAMRSECHVIRFCHRRNLLHFGKPPCMRQIRLNNIYTTSLQKSLEIIFSKEPLSRSNWNITGNGNLFKHFHIFTQHRLFNKHRVELFSFLASIFAIGL